MRRDFNKLRQLKWYAAHSGAALAGRRSATANARNYTAAKPNTRIALRPTITAGTSYTGTGSGFTLIAAGTRNSGTGARVNLITAGTRYIGTGARINLITVGTCYIGTQRLRGRSNDVRWQSRILATTSGYRWSCTDW